MSRILILIFVFGCFFSMPNLKAQDPHWEYMDLPFTVWDANISGYEDTVADETYILGKYWSLLDTTNSISCNTLLATYNGVEFNTVGVFGHWVKDVVRFGDNIYAGGSFQCVDTNSVIRYLAKYDGEEWSSVGVFNDAISAITSDGNYLYVTGFFTEINGQQIHGIARYDGDVWEAIGDVGFGESSWVRDLICYQGDLYAAGGIYLVNDENTEYGVLVYQNGAWQTINGYEQYIGQTDVRTMKIFKSKLYLVGAFYVSPGADLHSSIIAWDGQELTAPYPNFYNQFDGIGDGSMPVQLVSTEDRLYAGGLMEYIGDQEVNQMAAYNGEQWCAMYTEGLDRPIYAMFSLRDTVYAYLYFNPYSATLYPSGLYKWVGGNDYENCETTGLSEMFNTEIQISPNPVKNYCFVRGDFNGYVKYVLYDISGRLVLQNYAASGNGFQLDLRAIRPGLYILKVQNGTQVCTKKIQKL